MILKFRAISNSDTDFLKKVYRSTREKELQKTPWTEKEKSLFIDFQFNAQHAHYINMFKGAEFKIILLHKKRIGRLYIWEAKDEIRILDIALLPSFRNKGIGTAILNNLVDLSKKLGKSLRLHVEKYNPAFQLYKNLGFDILEDKGQHYFMEFKND